MVFPHTRDLCFIPLDVFVASYRMWQESVPPKRLTEQTEVQPISDEEEKGRELLVFKKLG